MVALNGFLPDEASTLAKAIAVAGYAGYPVPQRDRDALFLRYRDLDGATVGGPCAARRFQQVGSP